MLRRIVILAVIGCGLSATGCFNQYPSDPVQRMEVHINESENYRQIGEVFRRCPGWSAFVFTGNAKLADKIGLEPVESVSLFNGKIPCRLLRYDILSA